MRTPPKDVKRKPNILFISVDDLRPELGCYGKTHVHSPAIDRLAREGRLFERAYCQQPICGPSRTSLLTGKRPDRLGITENDIHFRDLVSDTLTLPEYFGQQGYDTVGIGKVFHDNVPDPQSWNRPAANIAFELPEGVLGYQDPETLAYFEKRHPEIRRDWGEEFIYSVGSGPVCESMDLPDDAYQDGQSTERAIATLHELGDRPFFMGVGFKKPHLPFIAPEKYWALYDPETLPLTPCPEAPLHGTALGLHASFELRTRMGVTKEGPLSESEARHLIHGYLAGVSYTDAQVGRLLDTLDDLGLRENTIIVLWADHGWHLGDLGIWGKATLHEQAARIPLLFSLPRQAQAGVSTTALAELVDLFPTLCSLADLPLPDDLDGEDLSPVLKDPRSKIKSATFTQFPCTALREWAARPLSEPMRKTFFGPLIEEQERKLAAENPDRYDRDLYENHLMGYSIRTDLHRLTLWVDERIKTGEPFAVELYDHQVDPNETVNLAGSAEVQIFEKELTQQLGHYITTGSSL